MGCNCSLAAHFCHPQKRAFMSESCPWHRADRATNMEVPRFSMQQWRHVTGASKLCRLRQCMVAVCLMALTLQISQRQGCTVHETSTPATDPALNHFIRNGWQHRTCPPLPRTHNHKQAIHSASTTHTRPALLAYHDRIGTHVHEQCELKGDPGQLSAWSVSHNLASSVPAWQSECGEL